MNILEAHQMIRHICARIYFAFAEARLVQLFSFSTPMLMLMNMLRILSLAHV